MRNKYDSPSVFCPFYKGESLKASKIFCEGIQKGTSLHLAFESSAKMRAYRDKYCNNKDCYLKCMIADMLDYNKY
jgi:hypothetical protein